MLFDWFTVLAQLVNFLVLVWLLKIFLYKPILKVIEERQNKIAKQLEEAEQKKREAEEESLLFQKKNKEFDQQKAEKMEILNQEMKQLQGRLRAEAKQEIEDQRAKWLTHLDYEKKEVFRDLSQRMQRELFSIMRKVMSDLADTDIQEKLVDVFLQRLKDFSKKEKLPSTLEIRMAFDPTEKVQKKIETTLQEEFNRKFNIHFVVQPELIGGIELLAEKQKISWNISDYLSSLERATEENIHA